MTLQGIPRHGNNFFFFVEIIRLVRDYFFDNLGGGAILQALVGCEVSSFPSYLYLPLGRNPRSLLGWNLL